MTCFNSAGISGIGIARAASSRRRRPFRITMLNFAERVGLVGKSSRKCAPRLSLRSMAAARDRFRHRQQVVQIERRVPAGVVFAVAADAGLVRALPQALRAARAASRISLLRGRCRRGPASCPAGRAGSRTGSRPRRPRSNGSSALARRCFDLRSRSMRAAPFSFANFAAYSPARLPNTIRSESELPPSRLAPLMPAALRRRRRDPGTVDICVSPSTRMPPIM